jgi:AcrR family transcriptional regulator
VAGARPSNPSKNDKGVHGARNGDAAERAERTPAPGEPDFKRERITGPKRAAADGSGPAEAKAPEPAAPSRDGRTEERYRRLPTGAHGLAREEVERDQRERLQRAMMELIAERGYQAVRILDLTQLAHVSRPTFYELYSDKEELLISAYNDIAMRTARTVLEAFGHEGDLEERLRRSMHAFSELAAAEPQAMSLFLLGAFGAGPKALARRKETVAALERAIHTARDGTDTPAEDDLTVKVQLGGIREVAVARLHHAHPEELQTLADDLIAWVVCYPPMLLSGLELPPPRTDAEVAEQEARPGCFTSERSRRVHSRLPSGRHDLPREVVVKSQRERIVDATAEIVAEKGLAALTIPEIASRANVSHETFYEMFPAKRDAFLEAQRTGMFGALSRGAQAWEAAMPDWPRAIAAGLCAVIDYLVAEPALAHLAIVDAFGASPETIAVRAEILQAFATYFEPGYALAPEGHVIPASAGEAVVGGVWQVLHHYIDYGRVDELPGATAQLTYMLLTPFIGAKAAKKTALSAVAEHEPSAAGAGVG